MRKKASIFIDNLNHENLFKILRKKEYENILFEVFHKLPNVTQVEYFRESMKWFETIEILKAQELVFEQLRKRIPLSDNAVFKSIPIPIRWLVYLSNFSNADFSKILKSNGGKNMYFPIIRGRQYDLLALRELKERDLISEKVVPIIEPIKFSSTLNSLLSVFFNKQSNIIFITNPKVGSFKDEIEMPSIKKSIEK